ncbi:hypothetical protein [Motiliproteus sp. SC1-56]|uniref:hypothetical protein n=1 Tax=Motiliproteus sp. SC1-56 TaxID=2799565 RepID=UPI001A8EBFC0|nr:hypothetical protein [Motiliproteus sp. SC1-56]
MNSKSKTNIFFRIINSIVNLICALENTSYVLAVRSQVSRAKLEDEIDADFDSYEKTLDELEVNKASILGSLKKAAIIIFPIIVIVIVLF